MSDNRIRDDDEAKVTLVVKGTPIKRTAPRRLGLLKVKARAISTADAVPIDDGEAKVRQRQPIVASRVTVVKAVPRNPNAPSSGKVVYGRALSQADLPTAEAVRISNAVPRADAVAIDEVPRSYAESQALEVGVGAMDPKIQDAIFMTHRLIEAWPEASDSAENQFLLALNNWLNYYDASPRVKGDYSNRLKMAHNALRKANKSKARMATQGRFNRAREFFDTILGQWVSLGNYDGKGPRTSSPNTLSILETWKTPASGAGARGGKKTRRRKPRGRKPRGRKTRGRKPKGRKTRGRKPKGRKTKGRKTRRRN